MNVIPQSWSHLHILIGVFPSFGLVFTLGLYITALRTGNAGLKRACLVVFVGLALLCVPIYISGSASQTLLNGTPRYASNAMATHSTWAMGALALLLAAGIAAAVELWRSFQQRRSPRDPFLLVLGLAVVALAVTIVTDEYGWTINHQELKPGTVIPDVSTPPAWSHAHLILNHVPTAGFVFALFFFIVALATNNALMKRASLVLFVICSIIGVPTYVAGTAAMWALTQPPIPEISKAVINSHRDMALWSLFGLAFTGTAAWLELWRYRQVGQFSRLALNLVLIFAFITLGIMTETGHRGGLINHPEIITAADVLPADVNAGVTPAIEKLVVDKTWYVPWQIVHFFGYSLIFGTAFAVGMRVLGFWKNALSFAAMHRLLLLGFFGVLMNVFSGMLMMLADQYRWVVNDYTFGPKLAFIVIGAMAVLYFSLSDRLWSVKPGDDAPATAKWVAAAVMLAWAGVIVCGRLLAYL